MVGTEYAGDHRCVGARCCIPRARGSRTAKGLQAQGAPGWAVPSEERSPDPLCPDTGVGLQGVNTPVKTASESSGPQPSNPSSCSRPTVLRNTGLIVSHRRLPKAVCSRDA